MGVQGHATEVRPLQVEVIQEDEGLQDLAQVAWAEQPRDRAVGASACPMNDGSGSKRQRWRQDNRRGVPA
jgi:hypothetical protein